MSCGGIAKRFGEAAGGVSLKGSPLEDPGTIG